MRVRARVCVYVCVCVCMCVCVCLLDRCFGGRLNTPTACMAHMGEESRLHIPSPRGACRPHSPCMQHRSWWWVCMPPGARIHALGRVHHTMCCTQASGSHGVGSCCTAPQGPESPTLQRCVRPPATRERCAAGLTPSEWPHLTAVHGRSTDWVSISTANRNTHDKAPAMHATT